MLDALIEICEIENYVYVLKGYVYILKDYVRILKVLIYIKE